MAKKLKKVEKEQPTKVRNGIIFQASQAFNSIDPTGTLRFGPLLIHKMNRIGRQLSERLTDFESTRKKLILNHSNKDDKGQPIVINGQYDLKDKAKFDKEFEELAGIEIEVEGLSKFTENDLKQLELAGVRLTRIDMLRLDIIIES